MTTTNPIVTENSRPGTTDWLITDFSYAIAGFASHSSVQAGDELSFRVHSDSPFDLRIFRSGYYGGAGGRLIYEVQGLAGQIQPEPQADLRSGLRSCSHWAVAHKLVVPNDWPTGMYIARLVRAAGGSSYIPFVVRETAANRADGKHAAILAQQSFTTYHAYNGYGGKSLYHGNSGFGITDTNGPRASHVSFDRPFSHHPAMQNTYFWSDLPMVYWLEANGYDVAYCTNIDTHTTPQALLNHKVFLSIGHDEYWTQAMRNALVAARNAGVHLGIFSANTGYWRVRLMPDPWTNQPNRTMVCYKTTEGGVPDPSGHATGTFRDVGGANQPENGLLGTMYIGDNDNRFFPMRVSAEQAQNALYRNVPLAFVDGAYTDIGNYLVGWEWDAVVDNGHTPKNLQVLAATPTYGNLLLDQGRTYKIGAAVQHTTRYIAESGAIVFAAGTNHWAWGLAIFDPQPALQQITYNLLADMGVHPAAPANALVLDAASATHSRITMYNDGTQTLQQLVQGVIHELRKIGAQPQTKPSTAQSTQAATPATAGHAPTISDIVVQPTPNTVTIAWKTDVPASGQMWVKRVSGTSDYSLPPATNRMLPVVSNRSTEILATEQSLMMDNLDANFTYYFIIAARAANGLVSLSNEGTFATPIGSTVMDGVVRPILRPINRNLPDTVRGNVRPIALGAAGVVALGGAGLLLRRARRLRAIRARKRS